MNQTVGDNNNDVELRGERRRAIVAFGHCGLTVGLISDYGQMRWMKWTLIIAWNYGR